MTRRFAGSIVLTARQAEIVDLVSQGLTDRAIAAALGISVRTVSNRLLELYAMTDCENRTQLAMLAEASHSQAAASATGGDDEVSSL